MVGGRRRPPQSRSHQDRAAKGLAEPGRPGYPRPPAALRKPLRVPVPEASGQTALGHASPLEPGAEGSRSRRRPTARSQAYRCQPGRHPGRSPVDRRADARARRPRDDPAIRPCRRPRSAGRRRAHRKRHRGCNEVWRICYGTRIALTASPSAGPEEERDRERLHQSQAEAARGVRVRAGREQHRAHQPPHEVGQAARPLDVLPRSEGRNREFPEDLISTRFFTNWVGVRDTARLLAPRIHDYRHRWDSQGLLNGVGLANASRLLRHRQRETTATRVHLNDDALRDSAARAATFIARTTGLRWPRFVGQLGVGILAQRGGAQRYIGSRARVFQPSKVGHGCWSCSQSAGTSKQAFSPAPEHPLRKSRASLLPCCHCVLDQSGQICR